MAVTIDLSPIEMNLVFLKYGADFGIDLQYLDDTDAPIDITGWSFRSELKKSISDPVPLLLFPQTINVPSAIVTVRLGVATINDLKGNQIYYWQHFATDSSAFTTLYFAGEVRVR